MGKWRLSSSCGQGNLTAAFARAIVAATPPEQLEIDAGTRGKPGNEVSEQLADLDRELATLQTGVAQTDERHGIEQLHLTVSAAYIATLLSNERVSRWLYEHHRDFAAQFETISLEARNERFRSDSSGPPSKIFAVSGKSGLVFRRKGNLHRRVSASRSA
ncbi:plasmid partitioning protein RepB C-terminal domain-containing protein [Paraburkholderia sp. BR10872]|uniref:plasmid partitioning protein RepB C-terminal domain-containing protein n=1 Tax=Paraburkholderia sp. BR10872 TaxID=3236989 RepID=UPI0034D29938